MDASDSSEECIFYSNAFSLLMWQSPISLSFECDSVLRFRTIIEKLWFSLGMFRPTLRISCTIIRNLVFGNKSFSYSFNHLFTFLGFLFTI